MTTVLSWPYRMRCLFRLITTSVRTEVRTVDDRRGFISCVYLHTFCCVYVYDAHTAKYCWFVSAWRVNECITRWRQEKTLLWSLCQQGSGHPWSAIASLLGSIHCVTAQLLLGMGLKGNIPANFFSNGTLFLTGKVKLCLLVKKWTLLRNMAMSDKVVHCPSSITPCIRMTQLPSSRTMRSLCTAH